MSPSGKSLVLLVQLGAALIAISALAAQGLLFPGHLLGAALVAGGLLGLAWRGELALAEWWPGARFFWTLLALVGVGYAVLMWACYESMSFSYRDTGVAAERIAALAERGVFYNYALHRHALADHFCPALAAFVPLWWIWPTFLWLPIAKVLAFLLTAVLLVPLGREILGSSSKAVWALPTLWLLHTFVGMGVLFEFQTDHLAPPAIVATFLFAARRRYLLMLASLILLAGLKENMTLVWVCAGLWLAIERGQRRLGYTLAATGLVIGVVIFFVVMPAFSDGVQVHQSRFGPTALLPEKLTVVTLCLLSLGALPLARPSTLLWSLPILGLHLVSRFEQMFNFRYHYFLSVMAVLFVASLHGLRDILSGAGFLSRMPIRGKALALAACAGAVIAMNGWLPFNAMRLHWPTDESRIVRRELMSARALVPPELDVYAGASQIVLLIPHPRVRELEWSALPERDHAHVIMLSKAPSPGDPPAELASFRGRLEAEVVTGDATRIIDTEHIVAYRRGADQAGAAEPHPSGP